MEVFSDEWYNALEFEVADAKELQEILSGYTVADCAPCDYPAICGVEWTLYNDEGKIIVVQTVADWYNEDTGFALLWARPRRRMPPDAKVPHRMLHTIFASKEE